MNQSKSRGYKSRNQATQNFTNIANEAEGARNYIDSSMETKFFKTKQIHPMFYYYNQKQSQKIQQRQADLTPQITSLVQHVHSGLQTNAKKVQARRTTVVKKKTKSLVKNIKSKDVVSVVSMPERREAEAQTRLSTIDNSKSTSPLIQPIVMSIPRLKAVRNFKSLTKNYHVVPASIKGMNHFQHQQRYKKVIEHRDLLEGMLIEHKQLQRDRQSMVHEIQMMRNYLDDIRGRLDNSLRKLNDNPSYTIDDPEINGLRKKSLMRSMSLPRRVVV